MAGELRQAHTAAVRVPPHHRGLALRTAVRDPGMARLSLRHWPGDRFRGRGVALFRRLGHTVRPAGAGPHPRRCPDADRLRIRLRAPRLFVRQARDDELHTGFPYAIGTGLVDGPRRLVHAVTPKHGSSTGATDI